MSAITDARLVTFLMALDKADFEVSEWEAGFIGSFLARPDCLTATFSPRQREVVEKMVDKYLHRLPASTLANAERRNSSSTIPPSAPVGHCNYLVGSASGALARCGNPIPEKQDFCAACNEKRDAGLKKMRQLKEFRLRS